MKPFCPILLIGIGGTGSEILMRVREQIKRNNQDFLNNFLFIDTDIKTAFAPKGYTKIENSEVCTIGNRKVNSFIENSNLCQYKGISTRFPSDELNHSYVSLLSNGTGAAQIRSLGALAFTLDHKKVRNKIKTSIEDLANDLNNQDAKKAQRGETKKQRIVVYIVASLVGGTGSGGFVDAAVIVRDVVNSQFGWDVVVVGVFVFHQSEKQRIEQYRSNFATNIYSSLMELQYLYEHKCDKILYDSDISAHSEEGETVKVFDMIYLANKMDIPNGNTLNNLLQQVASLLIQDIKAKSHVYNPMALYNIQHLQKLTFNTYSDKIGPFSTIAESSLLYPVNRVTEYCTNKSLNEVISDQILGSTESFRLVNNEVETFLQKHDLDARAPGNRIIHQLLKRETGTISSICRKKIDPKSFGNGKDVDKLLDKLNSDNIYLDSVIQLEVDTHAKENKRKLLYGPSYNQFNRLENIVAKWVVDLVVRYNVNTAINALQKLKNVCKSMVEQLNTELSDWEMVKKQLAQEIDKNKTLLNNLGWFEKKFGTHKDIIYMSILLHNEFVDAKIMNMVKSHAIEVIDILRIVTTELFTKWSNLVQILQSIQQRALDKAEHCKAKESNKNIDFSRFVTEVDITEPGHESEYYMNHYVPSSYIYSGIVSRYSENHGKEFNEEIFVSWLLEAANHSKAIDVISEQMKELIVNKFWNKIQETNIFQFIQENTPDPEAFIKEKMQILFDLCTPLLQFDSQMLTTNQMQETYSISIAYDFYSEPVNKIAEWVIDYFKNETRGLIIHTDIPYKFSINRKVHGAKANFILEIQEWERIYKKKLLQTKGNYMLHTHSAFNNIPFIK